jgi:hypothetical protein
MYELFGALAFAVLVASYVLAIIFIQHEDDGAPGCDPAEHKTDEPQLGSRASFLAGGRDGLQR